MQLEALHSPCRQWSMSRTKPGWGKKRVRQVVGGLHTGLLAMSWQEAGHTSGNGQVGRVEWGRRKG